MQNNNMFRMCADAQMCADGVGEIKVYSSITSYKYNEKDPEVTAIEFGEKIKAIQGATRVNLRINSPGGVVTQAVAMRAMMNAITAPERHIYIEGLCASAATLLATVPGWVVHIYEGSLYMIHCPNTYVCGTADDIEKTVERLRLIEEDCRAMYTHKCGKSDEIIKAWMDETKWFSAKQAVEEGFADELIEATAEIVACVTTEDAKLMQDIYGGIPERIKVVTKTAIKESKTSTVRTATSGVASTCASENTANKGDDNMDINEITLEQLMKERPDLCSQFNETAAEAERARMQEIDELTPPGAEYAALALAAKKGGESSMEFHKKIIKAQRDKGIQFLEQRKTETASTAKVEGGSTGDLEDATGEAAMDANAKEIAEYAKAYRDASVGMY